MSSTGSIGGDGPRLTSVDDSEAPPRRAFTRAVRRIVPESGAIRSIALITFVDAVGLGLYSTGAIVFFVRSLHLPVGYVGVSLSIAAGIGLLASVPAGRLVDRRDAKQVLVALSFAQAVLFALFPLVEGRVAFFVVVSAAALAAIAAQPARRVLIVRLFDERRRVAATAYSRSVLNVGVSVGALLAAGALALDTRPAYDALSLGNAASFVGVGLLVARLRLPPRPWAAGTAEAGPPAHAARHPLRQPRFVAVSASCGILYLSASILDVALALQVSQHTDAPRAIIAFLLLLNTAMVVLLQVHASKGSDTIPGAARANRWAGLALLGSCVLFPLSSHRPAVIAVVLLIGATVLLTAGELFSSAGSWGVSYGLAPKNREGEYIASFFLVSQVVQVVGPALSAAVVAGGAYAWLLLGVVFLAAGLISPLIVGRSKV